MTRSEAINQSPKGTATRETKDIVGNKVIIIGYPDGGHYRLVSRDGKILFPLCGQPRESEFRGFDDWQPSDYH